MITRSRVAKAPMDCWHADTIGKITGIVDGEKNLIPTLQGNLYSITIIDEFTNYIIAIPIKAKHEAAHYIIDAIKLMQNVTGLKLKRFHSDGGTEFNNNTLIDFFRNNGTEFTISVPDTPEMNGRAERTNRSITTGTRCGLLESDCPPHLWD